MEVTLEKAVTHKARLISENVVREIIYLLLTCNPTPCANMADRLRKALEK